MTKVPLKDTSYTEEVASTEADLQEGSTKSPDELPGALLSSVDEYSGHGGTYLLDPATGVRTRISP